MSPKRAAACCAGLSRLLDPELFKAIADPTRANLLSCLVKCGGACAVGEIAACCSVDLSVVSRHLQSLERAGLLESRRQGREVLYAVRYAAVVARLRDLADAIEHCAPACDRADTDQPCCADR